MVSFAKTPPDATEAGFDQWLSTLHPPWPEDRLTLLRQAFRSARQHQPPEDCRSSLQAADLLADLGLDAEAVIAALLFTAVDIRALSLTEVRGHYGDGIADLVHGAIYLHHIGELRDEQFKTGRSGEQLENLRKMLLAVARDIRVVLIMLAVRVCLLHNPPDDVSARRRLARESLDIFAPLANRLGIGQFKWELEDLALRDLEPDVYKTLARALDERRADRERYIENIVNTLKTALSASGIEADVYGRAKHIYSIWNKMRRKRLFFKIRHTVLFPWSSGVLSGSAG